MDDTLKSQILSLIKDNLKIEVETKSEYIGDWGDSTTMYRDYHLVTLELDGEVISSICL